MPSRGRNIVLSLSGALCLTIAPARAQNPPPETARLLTGALVEGEAFRKQLPDLEYDASVRVTEFDRNGGVCGNGKATMIVRPGEAQPITYLSRERHGKIMLPDEKPKSLGDDDDDNTTVPEFAARHQVAQRFNYELQGRERVAGQSTWRVSFVPRSDQPEKNRADRFLDAIAGRGWVNEGNGRLLKFEMQLQHPFELFWILAVLKEFSFRYEILQPDEILGRARIVFRFNLSTPVWSLRQEHEIELDHFRHRSQLAGGMSSANPRLAPR